MELMMRSGIQKDMSKVIEEYARRKLWSMNIRTQGIVLGVQ